MRINSSDFMRSNRCKGRGKQDVGMSIHIAYKRVNFILRNNSYEKVSALQDGTSGKYLLIAYKNGRVYFKGTNNADGFLVMQRSQKNKYCYVSEKFQTKEFKAWANMNIGNFDLQYDTEAGMYYISNEIQFMSRS